MKKTVNELWEFVEETFCDNMDQDARKYFKRIFKYGALKILERRLTTASTGLATAAEPEATSESKSSIIAPAGEAGRR